MIFGKLVAALVCVVVALVAVKVSDCFSVAVSPGYGYCYMEDEIREG